MRLKSAVINAPFVWDLYAYFWLFHRQRGVHRSIFPSFEEASAVCTRSSSRTTGNGAPCPASNDAEKVGIFDPRDYPLLVWLAKAFENSSTVFDLGGSIGLAYYAYSRFVTYPKLLRWMVCEVPEFCQIGQRVAAEKNAANLEFTGDFSKADDVDILLTCGTLQCLDAPFATLIAKLTRKPKHLLVQRVPLGDGPTFYTLEVNNSGRYYPYRIQNKRELFDSLIAQGYSLIDSWRDSRTCRIPFHPSLTVNGYCGAYFQLDTP